MGYRIFVLCLKQLLVNWKIALRLSWFWALAIVVVYLGMLTITNASFVNMTGDGGGNGMTAKSGLLFLPIWLVLFFAITIGPASIAIGWHRYVLRGEIPRSPYFLPAEKTFWPYIWRGFKVGLKVVLIILPLFAIMAFAMTSVLPGMFAMQPSGAVPTSFLVASTIGNLLMMTLVSWLTMRMGLGLPGTAVGQDVRSSASWKMTGPISGALFTAAILVAVLLAIPSLLAALIAGIFPIQSGDMVENMLSGSAHFWNLLPVPIYLAFSIVSFFVGFGILTVVYGHLQEGKPI